MQEIICKVLWEPDAEDQYEDQITIESPKTGNTIALTFGALIFHRDINYAYILNKIIQERKKSQEQPFNVGFFIGELKLLKRLFDELERKAGRCGGK